MPPLNLADLELQLIDILSSQGLPVEEIRLIGLLGKGTRATVFSVMIDGVYHVLKVYDSNESLRAELKNLKKVTPKDRFLFYWQNQPGDDLNINLAILEVPEGRELSSGLITPSSAEWIAGRITELHSIRYRQRVSQSSLVQQLDRHKKPFLDHIVSLERDPAPYMKMLDNLKAMLIKSPDLFRANKVRLHGDFWWPNIVVAKEDVYFIDWESVRRGDAAEDIAKLRVYIYGYRTPADPIFFWEQPSDGPRMGELVEAIARRHQTQLGDDSLPERLKFYLPLFCIEELANRFMLPDAQVSMNKILADDALALADDPFAAPPDLTKYGYFDEVQSLRING